MTSSPPGPRSRELAGRLGIVESPNVTYLAEDFPIFWDSAVGSTVTDADGNTYLDLTSAFGVAAIGHGHPAVVATIHEQTSRLLHGMGDVHPSGVKVELCEQLAALAPFDNGQVILTGGGAEAVEAALKTACITTERPSIVAFEHSYHGLSYGTLSTTWRPDFRAPWAAQLSQTCSFVPFPTADTDLDEALSRFERALAAGTSAGPVGAVLFEPIQGRGGVRVPVPGFLREVAQLARNADALLIADEIFTGLWRTGTRWACEAEGTTPDIVVCGKALGGGMPIGACIGSPEAMAGWPRSTGEALHTSTFLGHPVVCAAALAALTVLEDATLQGGITDRGGQLAAGLERIVERDDSALAVRGRGMMYGLVLDSAERCARAMAVGLAHGVILLGGGTDGDVLTITPPFVITEAELDDALGRLSAALDACT